MTVPALTLMTTVGASERPLVIAAARQLSAAVSTALGEDWPVHLVLAEPDDRAADGAIWIASLIEDVLRDEPIEATTARWRDRIARRSAGAGSRVLLSTLFRKTAGDSDGASIERIRRLNMMALSLSRTTGIEIVDIDRVFAWCGATVLQTDYRCHGAHAAAVGGHAVAAAILAGGLDQLLPAPTQDKAIDLHGGVQNIALIVQRRILRP